MIKKKHLKHHPNYFMSLMIYRVMRFENLMKMVRLDDLLSDIDLVIY